MTGIGYFQNLQAIHFLWLPKDKINRSCVCCAAVRPQMKDKQLHSKGVWTGPRVHSTGGCSDPWASVEPDMGKHQNLRPCRKANQLARRFIKGNSSLQVQLYLLWCDAEKKFCFIKAPKNTKKAEKSFSGVTICFCKLHEHSFPRKIKLSNLSRVWLLIIDAAILKLCLSNCDNWRHTSLHWKGKVGINCSVSVSSVVTFVFPSITFGRAILELLAVNQCGT